MVKGPWKQQCAPCSLSEQQLLPHHFERHQWQKKKETSILYLLYRWCIAIYFVTVLFCSIFNGNRYGKTNNTYWKWVAFLTNWGHSLCTIQAVLALYIVQMACFKRVSLKDGRVEIPRYYKIYWILQTAATDVAYTITLMYWGTIYSPVKHRLDAINIMVHATNSALMLIDLSIVAFPNKFIHFIYSASVGLTYSLFGYIYYACGGTDRDGNHYIYSAMDWTKPERACIFIVICVTVVISMRCVNWSLTKLRLRLGHSRAIHVVPPNSPLVLQEKPFISSMA